MNFFQEWNADLLESQYIRSYLNKESESRFLLRYGSEDEVKYACNLLRKVPMETFIEEVIRIDTNRLPETFEIPQCGIIEKAICEVPQILAFSKDGLLCQELGLKLGAENHGDAPRKSGEGNGKLADAMDLAIRMKLPDNSPKGEKYGYKISALGRYLLRYPELEAKMDIISRLLIREYLVQVLISNALNGYASYNDAVSGLKSSKTRMRRRQNVRRIINCIDSELASRYRVADKINWEIEEL